MNSNKNQIQNIQLLDDKVISERPVIDNSYQKKSLSKLLRSNITTKSYSGNNEEYGKVLLTSTIYNQIVSDIAHKNSINSLCNQQYISSNSLDIIINQEQFESGWVDEESIREITNITKFKKISIFLHEIYAQPMATQRLLDDVEINIESWLKEKLVESFANLENAAILKGNGINKPYGILHYKNKLETLNVKTDITFSNMLNLTNMLKTEYMSNAVFIMHRNTLTKLQNIKDNTGRHIWQPYLTDKMQENIFGIPVILSDDMPEIQPNAIPIIFANLKKGYQIIHREGILIIRDAITHKPYVKFYATKRIGGDVICPNAIKLLKISNE